MPEATVTAVAETRQKVVEFLAGFEGVEIGDDGSVSLPYGSARVYVTVRVFDEDEAAVEVSAAVVTGATPSPELFRHVATFAAEIGHLRVEDRPDGTCTVHFGHTLIGEFLNAAELRLTVVAVAHGADQIDDALAAQFGGTVHLASGNHDG